MIVVAKVQEKLEKFGKGELDVVRGALIPLAVLGLAYRNGVRPMIGRHNDVGSLFEYLRRCEFSYEGLSIRAAMVANPSCLLAGELVWNL